MLCVLSVLHVMPYVSVCVTFDVLFVCVTCNVLCVGWSGSPVFPQVWEPRINCFLTLLVIELKSPVSDCFVCSVLHVMCCSLKNTVSECVVYYVLHVICCLLKNPVSDCFTCVCYMVHVVVGLRLWPNAGGAHNVWLRYIIRIPRWRCWSMGKL